MASKNHFSGDKAAFLERLPLSLVRAFMARENALRHSLVTREPTEHAGDCGMKEAAFPTLPFCGRCLVGVPL